jgi:hypothetical protein
MLEEAGFGSIRADFPYSESNFTAIAPAAAKQAVPL